MVEQLQNRISHL
jgi:hypothetical protein